MKVLVGSLETGESLCLREEEGKARHMTTLQSKRGQFGHLIILPAILFTCIHIFFIPGATVINKKDTGLHVRLNSGFCFSLSSMSDFVKDILPFLGLSLLFLEGEVGITLSLGYLLALTVGDYPTCVL